jgi:sarcosine oxidase subunit beta
LSSADVVVVGGGIIGVSVAYYLSKQGMKVTLFERGALASEASGSNQGGCFTHLRSGRILDLARESIHIYGSLERELSYDLAFERTGSYVLMDKDDQWPVLEEHAKQLQQRNLNVKLLTGNELREINPDLDAGIPGGSYLADDFMVNPMRVVFGFAEAAKRMGAEINTFTPVVGIATDHGKLQSVATSKGEVKTKFLVIAAGAWSPLIAGMLQLRVPIRPRRGLVLLTESHALQEMRVMLDIDYLATAHGKKNFTITDSDRVRLGVAAIITQTSPGNFLVGSSRDFPGYDKSSKMETLTVIARRAARFFPKLRNMNLIRTMSGLRPFCEDDRFIIGRVHEIDGVVLATGHHGSGVIFAPLTGQLVAELIAKDHTPTSIEEFGYDRFPNHIIEDKEQDDRSDVI